MPPVDDRDRTEARILNWWRWARGGLPAACRAHTPADPCDTIDAERVEFVMRTIKARRPGDWAIVECRYMRGWAPLTSANFLLISERTYRDRVRQLLAYVAGALDAQPPTFDAVRLDIRHRDSVDRRAE